MALTKCPECGNDISDKAAACPHCGVPRSTAPAHQIEPSTATVFREPATGRTVSIANAGWWTLLFGCFYFLARGIYTHALISFGAAFITAGISWLIYPFFAQGVVRDHMIRQGWLAAVSAPAPRIDRRGDKWIWLFFGGILLIIAISALVNR